MTYREISPENEREIEWRHEREGADRLSAAKRLERASDIEAKAERPLGPGGTEMVKIAEIEDPGISGPEDFRPGSYDSLKREIQMHEQMRPYIEQGYGLDAFDQWDTHNKIGAYSEQGYVRGYRDVYYAYYGNDAIALSQRPDGSYGIINGRRRIALARELGIKQLPARVQR
jgi:hypothetical protein